MTDETVDPLSALATAHGIATSYEDGLSRPRKPSRDSLRAVLAAMGVPAADAEQVQASLRAVEEQPWREPLPPCVVARADRPTTVTCTVPAIGAAELAIEREDGEVVPLSGLDAAAPEGQVDGHRWRRPSVTLPDGLPLGTHRLRLRAQDLETTAHLLSVPAVCPAPTTRQWGWQVQLYALRSALSWGMGDLGDLRTLVRAAGQDHGAGFVLLNPLHAVQPVLPQQPSPYSPASRRFCNPLYLRIEDCDGYAALGPEDRAQVDALANKARTLNDVDRIDRDAVFHVKRLAFTLLHAQPLPSERAASFAAYREREGQGLIDFATACALAEQHGPSFHDWPAPLRDPRDPAVDAARRDLAAEVALHTWLQWQCNEQIAAAAAAAHEAGMPIGLMADLAIGVDPGGADAWALQADLALGVTVGAPSDPLAPQGQDWGLPPLRPDRLRQTGYAPFRDLVRTTLQHANALRFDHILGLFRLFWIPEGTAAADGTYVRYPADDLLGVLALEAARANAVIVGEDLGTVGPEVRSTLADRGVLSFRLLWFEREAKRGTAPRRRLPSHAYPELALTTVTTHDLPTATGYLANDHTRIRATIGVIPEDDVAAENARHATEVAELLDLLREEGLLPPDTTDPRSIVQALHAFVARTPSLLVGATLQDGPGDRRQPNVPGTTSEYPNWRLPVALPNAENEAEEPAWPSTPLPLEDLLLHPGVHALARTLSEGRGRS